jgi:hypothetical protein
MITQEVTSIYYAHTSGHANMQFDSLMSNYNGGKSRIHVVKIIEIKYKKEATILNNLFIMNAWS